MGDFGSAPGGGKIFGGISDGGSIGAVGEGDAAGRAAGSSARAAGMGELPGVGEDCAQSPAVRRTGSAERNSANNLGFISGRAWSSAVARFP